MKAMALKVIEIQRAHGLDVSQDDVSSILKFGLVEVVYEWARGLSFKHITDLTDVLEGILHLGQFINTLIPRLNCSVYCTFGRNLPRSQECCSYNRRRRII